MRIRKSILTIALALCAIAAINARTIADFFTAAEGAAFDVIPPNLRAEMIAYFGVGRVVPVETVYGEQASLVQATDNYVKVRTSAASEVEMLMLTRSRDTVLYVVQTVETPASDSRITAVDTKGRQLRLEKLFKEPQLKDFVRLPKGSKMKPEDVLAEVRFPLISYSIDDSALTITARQNLKDFMSSDDYAKIAPYLTDSITYQASGTRFKRVK